MQGALIGFGTIAMGHLAAYLKMDNLDIKAVVDPSHERLKQAINIDPKIRTYNSFEEMLAHESLEFIDICSPPHTHFDYIEKGLSNHYHVLCEKPLLLSTEHYKRIISLAKSKNKIVYPCHNYKFAPILKYIKDIINSGELEKVISGHFRTLRAGHALGVPEWDPHWRRHSHISGGGILQDHGPHSIYIACEMCGEFPKAVSCITGNLKQDSYSDTEDTALLTLYFENDIKFIIDLSWAASFRNSYYGIIGSGGTIVVENDKLIQITKDRQIKRELITSEFNDPSHKNWFQEMFLDFMNVVINPFKQIELSQEAYITSLVIEKAYLSAKQGGVKLDLSWK